MQTFLVLAGTAGIAAAVVWRATAPPAERARRARAPAGAAVPPRAPHVPARRPRPASRRRSERRRFTYPAPAREQADVSAVLAEIAVPDRRPSRLFALVRLILTLALVAVVAVAIAAGVWLVVSNQLAGSLGR